MPNMHKERVRGLRNIPEDLWVDFEKVAAALNSDRSAELRRYMEWVVRRPGAEEPRRPEPPTS